MLRVQGALPVECVADRDLEIRTVHHARLDLAEEPLAMLDPDEQIEPALRARVAIEVEQHQSGPAAGVDVPGSRAFEFVGELEVEAGDREVVAEADLDVRSEGDVLDERRGLEMAADHKLIG